jgi:hypothetical protein
MKTSKKKSLKDFMSPQQRRAMKGLPTYHSICLEKTGVARPGKSLPAARSVDQRGARGGVGGGLIAVSRS